MPTIPCDLHSDHTQKLLKNCTDIAALKEKASSIEEQVHTINETIFSLGGEDSLKSRIKGTEDEIRHLKDEVLINREMVIINTDKVTKGMMKIFTIFVSILIIVLGGMFSLVWYEIRDLRAATMHLQLPIMPLDKKVNMIVEQ